MVADRLADGTRIAQLLASEVTGLRSLSALAVADADRDAEPTVEGALAYRLVRRPEGDAETTAGAGEREVVASVYVHPDRARLEFGAAVTAVAEAAAREGLRVRPKTTHPPKTLVFVEDGAQVKRAVAVLEAVA